MRIKLFFLAIALTILCGWISQSSTHIKNAKWLIGTWENKTKRGSIFETWIMVNNTEFLGKSYMIKNQDTVVFETIRIILENDSLYYIPVVKNQNNGEPVRFVGVEVSKNKILFENKEHDYPQIISYTKIKADSLVATISGTKNGKERIQTFPMKRVDFKAQNK